MAETITNPPFTGVHNFRDVGKVINSFKAVQLKEGLLFRSGRLDDATTADTKLLVDGYHLKTVIDLRNKSEHLKQKEVLRKQSTSIQSGQVKSWDTVKINFTGRKFEINLVRQLKWWQFIWFMVLMLVQYRMAAIRILATNVMSPRGLVGLSKDSLQFCQSEILQALEVYIDPQAYPILVHCTQGKDRSGLIIMIVLFILGVPVDAVKEDYILSGQGLDRVRESMMEEIRDIGMDEKYILAPGEVVEEVWKFLQEGGGVDVYLDGIGFGESKRQRLRELLLEL